MTSTSSNTPVEHLQPSELGTKEYWDEVYATELGNHASNPSDVGTIWFSDAGAEERVLSFLEVLSDDGVLHKSSREHPASSFVDIGTGNGHFLWEMRRGDWEGALVGVDYSEDSIKLARRLGWRNQEEEEDEDEDELIPPRFEVWNIMTETPDPDWFPTGGFDVVLDKGTFDAISLSKTVNEHGQREFEGYREKVEKLAKSETGRVIITSCNWAREELRSWFEVEGGELVYEREVKYPSFKFGGKEGQSVCTLCFKKKAKT